MATFIKLLAINILAIKCLGLARSIKIFFAFLDFSDFKLLISEGDKEKKAVSEADINADNKIRTNRTKINTIIFKSIGLNDILKK